MAAVLIPADAQTIIDRLDRAWAGGEGVLDRARVERSLADHFTALGLTPLPVRWASDAEHAYRLVYELGLRAARSAAWSAARSAAWSAARSAAWSAARSAAWSAAESAAESAAWSAASRPVPPAIDRYIGIWLPFVDAYEAGLWLFFVCREEVIAVPRPVMRVEGEQLHCADGPAVHWPGGAQYFFWRGLPVPADLILHPETITVANILGEPNTELRRVRMERYGEARFLVDAGAAIVSRDSCGVLYALPLQDDEPLTMVKVINSTAEPDGHFKEYWLRVPPTVTTARAAIAWSFDLKPSTYRPTVET